MAPRSQDIEMDNIDSKAEDRDPESLQQLPRGLSWTKSWKASSNRVGTNLSAASIGSAVSHWSFEWRARWSPASKKPIPETVSPECFSKAQNDYLAAIIGPEPLEELQDSCTWYINYLAFKVRDAWATMFIPVLSAVVETYPSNEDMSIAFQIFKIVVLQLRDRDLALSDIVDALYNEGNEGLLRYTDPKRSNANQLVLASLGWITCLYPPETIPEPGKLQIRAPWSSACETEKPRKGRMRRRALKETFTNFSQDLEYTDQPLNVLLGIFGRIIPRRQRHMASGQASPYLLGPQRQDEPRIELSLLRYHILKKVANIEVEWVDSLSLHLEFDKSTKILKLFRLPSLCLLMCCCENESPLTQLFSDPIHSNDYTPVVLEDASDYHHEILLSYRLFFGQDKPSYSDFHRYCAVAQDQEYPDHLLPTLCGAYWEIPEAKKIYDLIGADEPSQEYIASVHFPFLGQRLLELQDYVKRRNAGNVRSIWHDKRNATAWWTFWAVVFFGGVSILLSLIFGFLGTILAGYQVYYADQQVHYAKLQVQQQALPP